MWIMSVRGFYSAVQHPTNPAQVVVRARAKADLEALRPLVPGLKITATPQRDYQFRAVVNKPVWQSVVAALAGEIDYGNYKTAVALGPGGHARADIYHDVWFALLGIAYRFPRHAWYDDLSSDYFNDGVVRDDDQQLNLVTGVMPRTRRRRRKDRART